MEALEQVGEWVRESVPGAHRLDVCALHSLGRGEGWDGWRLPLEGAASSALNLLIDADFPYSIPRFTLGDRPDLLKAPHVERKGALCLSGTDARADTLDPVAVVAFSYQEALSLVVEDEGGGNRDDFGVDFVAYWFRDGTLNFPFRSWLRREPKSRMVAAWHGKQFYFVAETVADCRGWMANRYGADDKRAFHDAAVIWIDSLPEPDAYPDNTAAVRRLVRSGPTMAWSYSTA